MRPRKVLSDGHRRAQAPGAKAQRPGQRGRADHGHGRRDAAPGRPGGGLTSRVRKTTRTPGWRCLGTAAWENSVAGLWGWMSCSP